MFLSKYTHTYARTYNLYIVGVWVRTNVKERVRVKIRVGASERDLILFCFAGSLFMLSFC